MKNISLLFTIILLTSCSPSDESFNVNGTWALCRTVYLTDYVYEELIINNSEYQKSLYNALDSECTDIDPAPVIRDIATHRLDNPHYTDSGLYVYDLTLTNIISQSSTGSTSIPNWYSIAYRQNNRLYSGLDTGVNDGSSEKNRHTEINFNNYLVKK